MYCWQYSLVCNDNVWSSMHKASPIVSKAKPKLMELWSYLGQNTQPKNTPKVCPSDMNHQASVLVRRPVAGCSSLGFFNEHLATWERTRFERKRWRHWKSLLYLFDDIDYDIIMIIICIMIVLMIVSNHVSYLFSHVHMELHVWTCEAVIRSSERGRQ